MTETTKRAMRALAYPLSFVIVMSLGVALARAGYETLALLVPMALLAAALEALERIIPYEPAWRASRGDVPTDVAHAIAAVVLSPLVQATTIAVLPTFDDGWLARAWFPLEVALVVALGDLLPYAYHRASHEWSGALFRIHAVHHSPTRLWWLNAFRMHPLNLAANVALRLAPAIALGASHEALVIAGIVLAFVSAFSHANVDSRTEWLDAIVATPTAHRIHHHVEPATSQANYGGTLLVWDLLFGSLRRHVVVRDGEIGVGDAVPREGWLAQLVVPLGVSCCGRAR